MYHNSCKACFRLIALALLGLVLSRTTFAEGGGNILPPSAKPHGFSLTDMAGEAAFFNITLDPAFYPGTPFQLLFADFNVATFTPTLDGGLSITGGNNFTVHTGTPFYVPLLNVDDSPPIIGTFPARSNQTADYFFDPMQVGARDMTVTVDGRSTRLGPHYVSGLVHTAPLPDGGGMHMITLAAFLSPMSSGIHTVTISGQEGGSAISSATGFNYIRFVFIYTVDVVPHARRD